MAASLSEEQECRQDMLRHLQRMVTILARHIDALDEGPDTMNMKPGECEQALDRHITILLRVLQVRQQFTQKESGDDDIQSWVDKIFLDDGENV